MSENEQNGEHGPGDENCLVICHATFGGETSVHGPAHSLVEYLVASGRRTSFIEHPTLTVEPSRWSVYEDGSRREQGLYRLSFLCRPLSWLIQVVGAVWIGWRRRTFKQVVGVDPLCFVSAWFLRTVGAAEEVVFYCADYADERFGNRLASAIYRGLDRFAAHQADAVWGVSRRIVELRDRQGIDAAKNFLVPNAPTYREDALGVEHQVRTDLVMIAQLEKGLDLGMLLEGFGMIGEDTDARLHIIGDGSTREAFEREVERAGLSGRVVMHGHLEHERAMAVVGGCGIGVAFYSDDAPWHPYRDSVKIREYLALGLPVITSPGHSLAEDVVAEGCGFTVSSAGDFADVSRRLMEESLYADYRQSAIAYAMRYSKKELLDEVYARMRD